MNMTHEEQTLHVVKCPPEYSACTGCGSCEMLCGMLHEGMVGPGYARIFMRQGPTHRQIYHVYTCQQCADAPCYEACPLKDKAMKKDDSGLVYIDEEACIGCGKCEKACKYTPSRIRLTKSSDRKKRKARKCDLCKGRPEGPACVQFCPAKCLELNDKPLPWEREGVSLASESDTPISVPGDFMENEQYLQSSDAEQSSRR